MPRLEVTIKTRDGLCPASLFTPAEGAGSWPAVIFFMDGLGIRPVMWEMGQRLADGGYLVLLPDLYYRRGSYPPIIPAQVLADPAARAELMKIVTGLDRDRKISDAAAFIEFLSSRPEVGRNRFGATGYCMGGNVALTAAGAFRQSGLPRSHRSMGAIWRPISRTVLISSSKTSGAIARRHETGNHS